MKTLKELELEYTTNHKQLIDYMSVLDTKLNSSKELTKAEYRHWDELQVDAVNIEEVLTALGIEHTSLSDKRKRWDAMWEVMNNNN